MEFPKAGVEGPSAPVPAPAPSPELHGTHCLFPSANAVTIGRTNGSGFVGILGPITAAVACAAAAAAAVQWI